MSSNTMTLAAGMWVKVRNGGDRTYRVVRLYRAHADTQWEEIWCECRTNDNRPAFWKLCQLDRMALEYGPKLHR